MVFIRMYKHLQLQWFKAKYFSQETKEEFGVLGMKIAKRKSVCEKRSAVNKLVLLGVEHWQWLQYSWSE